MDGIRLVARREITERLGSRTTQPTIALTALLVVALIAVPALFRRQPQPAAVGLVGTAAQALAATVGKDAGANGVPVRLTDLPDDAAARAALAGGSIGVALSIDSAGAVAEVKQSLAPGAASVLQAAVTEAYRRQILGSAGLPPATIDKALAPVPLTVTAIETPPPDRAARAVAALASGFLLYLTLGIYGGAVASGVAQEKTSRTAEVPLATVTPSQPLAGKVAGIGITGVVQMGITVAAGLLADAAVKGALISGTVWILLPSVLLWFLLGYALFGLAYAAAGAMVARQEDVNSVGTPITPLLVGGWVLTYAVVGLPGARWTALLSFVPFFAPMLMPARLALGHVPAWQVAADILLMLAAICAMVRLAARIYARALMRSGDRLSWRAAARL